MSPFNKHRPFISLSRRQRRKKVIELKNRIYRERHRCGGMFYDDCDIQHYQNNPDSIWAWSDIYFVGRDPADLWNAEIITAKLMFQDAVHHRAFNEAWAMLSQQQQEEFTGMMKGMLKDMKKQKKNSGCLGVFLFLFLLFGTALYGAAKYFL